MTRKSTIAERTRLCPKCEKTFLADKPSQKRIYCGHRCAFAVHGHKTRAAAATPDARKRNADTRRGRGAGLSYIKRDGRHEHRVVAEEKLGRALLPGEVVHHKDENRRNNSPENLEVLSGQGEHSRIHTTGTKRPPKMICKFGHALTPENVVITWAGLRRCLTCQRRYDREWKKARRQANQQENCI